MASSEGTETSKENLIFVYGTLKLGFPNHYLIEDLIRLNDAVPIPPRPNSPCFQTLVPYPLVLGPFGIPYLLNLPGSGLRVRGELYSVSARGVARLDHFEGVSNGHYQRLPVQVESSGVKGEAVDSYVYFGHRSFAEELWRKCGEASVEEYSATETGKYVKPGDRPAGLSFIDNIRSYLASDD